MKQPTETLSSLAHVGAVLAFLLAQFLPGHGLAASALWLVLAATVLRLRDLPPLAQRFCVGGVAAYAAVALGMPEQRAEVDRALGQGVAFSCLLAVLGVVRYPVRRSPTVREAARGLLGFPPRRRYAAVNAGCHFLSLLFNVGVIPLLGDLLHARAAHLPRDADCHRLVLASMRGAVLMTIWSPMGLGVAIVTTAIPALDPVGFIALAFGVSMTLMALTIAGAAGRAAAASDADPTADTAGLVADGRDTRADTRAASAFTPSGAARPDAAPGGHVELALVLAAAALLLAGAIGVHQWLRWSFIASTILVLPAFALAWLGIERAILRGATPAEHARGLLHGIADMRAESAIFLSASVIGAAVSLWVRALPAWQAIQGAEVPALAVLLACLTIVPLAGALFIPHTILIILIAQLFGASPVGQAHPYALGLALTLGWATAVSVSPISAMSLLSGRQCGVGARTIAHHWNRRFALALFAGSVATVVALQAAGY
ncbi:hypothetical protein [Derxia gummosa]|uniref:Uncharacterized protein n=1 Tax=Derxia gummosa DSM 723 TaxID=1121388 RepID=A0A8B6X461_9BURK|nr:hypothetical protein [Derxia gummosa]